MSNIQETSHTCAICKSEFVGGVYEEFDFTNYKLKGRKCKHCGETICVTCNPTKIDLKTLFGRSTCPLCSKKKWVDVGYYTYTYSSDIKKAISLLDSWRIEDNIDTEERDELLENHGLKIVEKLFESLNEKDIFGREGEVGSSEFLKIASLAEINAKHIFEDGTVEDRLIEYSTDPSPGIRYTVLRAMIRVENSLRSEKLIPTILKSMNDDFSGAGIAYFKNIFIKLAWNEEIVDALLKVLHSDPEAEVRQSLAFELDNAVGHSPELDEKVMEGLVKALDDDERPPAESATSLGGLFKVPPSVADGAADSLREISGNDYGWNHQAYKDWWEARSNV